MEREEKKLNGTRRGEKIEIKELKLIKLKLLCIFTIFNLILFSCYCHHVTQNSKHAANAYCIH